MFIAALSVIAPNQTGYYPDVCLSVVEYINKLRSIYSVEFIQQWEWMVYKYMQQKGKSRKKYSVQKSTYSMTVFV